MERGAFQSAIKNRGEMGERQDTGGLTTVLQLLGAMGRTEAGGGEQAELFEAEAPLPLAPAAGHEPRKVGRPAGSRNRSTAEWVSFFLSQNRSPLSVLGNIVSQPLEQLVDQLQAMSDKHAVVRFSEEGIATVAVARVNPLEVLKLQRDAAVALLPYIHRKQPMAVEIEQKQRGVVLIGELDVTDVGDDADLALPLPPTVENQRVSATSDAKSDASQSDADGLSSQFNGVTDDDR